MGAISMRRCQIRSATLHGQWGTSAPYRIPNQATHPARICLDSVLTQRLPPTDGHWMYHLATSVTVTRLRCGPDFLAAQDQAA